MILAFDYQCGFSFEHPYELLANELPFALWIANASKSRQEILGRVDCDEFDAGALLVVIGDLLALSALESGDMTLELAPLPIAGAGRGVGACVRRARWRLSR